MDFMDPQKVLKELELRKDMVAAEFGCGSGEFTILLARKLEDGRVYGLDVQPAALSALEGREKLEHLSNIETILCDFEQPKGSKLADSSIDVVIVANVLFQNQDKNAILAEAERVLKKDGQLMVVDWMPGAGQGPVEGRIWPEDVVEMTEKLGLKKKKEFLAGSFHYGLYLKKN